jgi:hypothetical protein
MSVETRNETVLEMFDGIRGMIYNFARRFHLEFDDVLQDAALIMLEVYPRIPADCTNAKAYLVGAVKRGLYKLLSHRGQETLSLDTPIASDATETFADMLEAFVEQDSKRSELVTKTVHNAMHRLSLEVQLHTRDYYKLGSYDPVLPRRLTRKVAYGRRPEQMRVSLKRSFRKDPQVLALMR